LTLFTKTLGSSGPLVAFDSGIGGTHLSWMGVAPRVAEFARVWLYDRAGLGFSPPAPEPRTARQCALEFDPPEPAILVGHSFGALIARLFAELNPARVRGLVLVDPIILGEWHPPTPASSARLLQGVRLMKLMAFAARFGLVGALVVAMGPFRGQKVSPRLEQLIGELEKLPPETWPLIRRNWTRSQSFVTLARYFQALPESCADGARFASLGDLPLTVLSGAHLDDRQLAEHATLAALSTRGQHIVARQGRHWIQLDDPDLIVDVIRRQCQVE
jgi:pimeloyl-ACP methyl ester carboxylesterase